MQIHLCNKILSYLRKQNQFVFEEDPLIYRIISSLMDWQVKRTQHTYVDIDTNIYAPTETIASFFLFTTLIPHISPSLRNSSPVRYI